MTGFVWNVSFQQDGGGWCGSFGIALRTFVEDVLSDGMPFDARITYEDNTGALATDDFRVTGYSPETGCVVVDNLAGDDLSIDLEDIRRFDA